ncbi:MAG: peptidoglycan editing factor PgeF [Candidatus Omnitrophica bacterium]|nr:peptidoglycan editing factor PgeF [Candidatus Omnitrophota bacterium]
MFKNFFPQDVTALFVDRRVDFILPVDAVGLSAQQKEFLLQELKLMPEKVFTMRQVHGNKILNIASSDLPQQGSIPDADGMVTNVKGAVLTMRTADCLPVFLCDPKKRCIGLVHAGWKGSRERIVVKGIESLTKNFGSHAGDILVAFGPSIRKCCYEVSEDFQKIFPAEVSRVNDRLCLNLAEANKTQLLGTGVKEENIFDSKECTVCNLKYFSYRRDDERSGRHLSLMVL